jgi:hypothetical protein
VIICDILGRIYMVTNLTGLKPLRLFSVGVLEGHSMSEESAHNSGTENSNLRKDLSNFSRNSKQGSK